MYYIFRWFYNNFEMTDIQRPYFFNFSSFFSRFAITVFPCIRVVLSMITSISFDIRSFLMHSQHTHSSPLFIQVCIHWKNFIPVLCATWSVTRPNRSIVTWEVIGRSSVISVHSVAKDSMTHLTSNDTHGHTQVRQPACTLL